MSKVKKTYEDNIVYFREGRPNDAKIEKKWELHVY
ncbi:DUF603 domain-containing protein (plasmid) [Borrelia miyamotoi]|uniref:DUF603 domain-containing protein n=1 Tax=Borrelia miyamotoi TaxID=47466 RepID=A0A5P8AUP5_9SPIR|nr:DUF603 domain-containing protein [Borrelia miyamotoi]QFP42434.1 DUF603 domain-containing protein [Borrelia miyamotoi]WAZ72310.1 DUF603 domain-containing protein [Borrelia miyamotoi]WVI05307.1 DUF603 domain-containing protein [Borrelia miyamotoi]